MRDTIRVPLRTVRAQFRAQLGLPPVGRVLHYQARHNGQITSGSIQAMLDPKSPEDLLAIYEILAAQGVPVDAEIEIEQVG
jgi:hypothetical protein